MKFRLCALELRRVIVPFRFAFTHAQASRRRNQSLLLAVHTDQGAVGYGEILPRRYLTGETLEEAWQQLRDCFWPAAKSLTFSAARAPVAALLPLLLTASRRRQTATYAGLDVALWDAWAQVACRPGAELFGQARPQPAPLTGPLGANSLTKIGMLTTLMRAVGYREFKLKVGNSKDLAAARLVRRLIGSRGDLRVDANGAWEVEEAIVKARALAAFQVSSLEQPIPPGEAANLARVERESGVPVMADESLCTLEDARDLLDRQAVTLWNLRLAKNGGFTGLLALIKMAGYPLPNLVADLPLPPEFHPSRAVRRPQLHLGVLVGETSLLGAAGRACLGLCPFRHLEFGFPGILLAVDPFHGDPGGYFGWAKPLSSQASLGVRPKSRLLDRITVAREVIT